MTEREAEAFCTELMEVFARHLGKNDPGDLAALLLGVGARSSMEFMPKEDALECLRLATEKVKNESWPSMLDPDVN